MNNRLLFILVAILFLIKIIAINFTNFDLFGDEAQYWLWSKKLDFGYYSKPPFLAWIISVYTEIFSDNFVSLKLFPSIVYILTAFAIYDLCKNIGLNKNNSLSCSLLFLFIPAVSFSSFILSTDIFLLLFWTLSLTQLLKIKKLPKINNFIQLGIFIGLAFLSKYAAVYFLICLLIYILLDYEFRVFFIKNFFGFFITIFCIFLILLPNIIWNLKNDWITIQHTSDNANLDNLKINFFRGFEFLFIQIFMLGPFIFIGNIIGFKNLNISKNQKMLLIFSIPIFLIVFIEAIIVRANANWAAPALVTFFLFLFIRLNNNIFKNLNLFFNFIFCIIFFGLIGTSYQSKIFNRINGLSEFADYVYNKAYQKNIENYVVSDRLLFASMRYQLKDKKVSFHMPHKKGDPVTNHFKLSSPLKKNMKNSFVLIGSPNDIDYLESNFNIFKKEVPEYKFTKKILNFYEVIFD